MTKTVVSFILGLVRPLQGFKPLKLSLEELVAAANHFLPDVLPSDISDQRIKDELTPRLVRHYTSQGTLDEPLKEGREARYTYRHLLQLLALRRLQAEGYRTGTVTPLTHTMSEPELESLVTGQAQVELAPAQNSALDFLQGLRSGPAQPSAAQSNLSPTTKVTRWTHFKLAPGLVIRMRDDYRAPHDTAALLKEIDKALKGSHSHRRS